MTEAYIARKNGMQKVTYAHPDMEPILNDTFGVAVYQEQLQQMFIDLAGYTSEDADYLREVLAKKKKQEMEKALPELRQRLRDRGWTEAQQEVFIGLCISSSAYSFNRSHSAAYGSVGYWCAFLKHFFPLEWWTGVLLYAKIDDIKKEYAHCVKKYLELPHVNGSSDVFELKDGKIHAPLYLIDGIGDAAVRAIRMERERGGKFKNMQDFFERIDKRAVNQTTFHQLILCDAFKNIEPDKRPKDLLAEYHYLKKVTSLKLGEGKKGSDLLDAVSKFKKKESEKGVTLDIPILYSNEIELEINRLKALPIYRLDVHHNFKSALEHFGMMIDSGATTYKAMANSPSTLVFRNTRQIEAMTEHLGRNIFGWAGLLQESDAFRYTDRRENRQVSALKLYIANDGDVLEAILWPDLKEKYAKAIKDNKIIIVFGTIKASREPGKWSMSIQELRTI
jgi:DNA polymerase III alpha subunit